MFTSILFIFTILINIFGNAHTVVEGINHALGMNLDGALMFIIAFCVSLFLP
jgi:hypothetical protein